MSEHTDLLVEIGTEELPPKSLGLLAERFTEGLVRLLNEADLTPAGVATYYTPRRLVVYLDSLALRQPDHEDHRLGPAVSAAFDAEGQPTPAAEGFARSVGASVAQLDRQPTDKGERLAFTRQIQGQPAEAMLAAIVGQALKALPIPKPMRWGATSEAFVRPVHWIVMLLGDAVVPGTLFGQSFGNISSGHRFHHPEPVVIEHAADYVSQMRAAHVVVDPAERRATIREQAILTAREAGGEAVAPEDLVEEVANLVEWPVALIGSFDDEFLAVPKEALVSSMQTHQRFFPVVDAEGALIARFVAFANIESRDPAAIRRGLERVIRPRLADARFFWQIDGKTPLVERRDALAAVIYQKRLGSVADKCDRVRQLAVAIAESLGEDAGDVGRAAMLCKCDLVTEMVNEFPELQGIMGRYYALNDGENDVVALAIEEHYRPRFAGDDLPSGASGRILAIADRLDTLAGIFAAGLKPTGNKDPFALRRAALGLIRLLIEDGPDLDLSQWFETALAALDERIAGAAGLADEVLDFVMDRLRAYYGEQSIGADVFEAVWARRPGRLRDFHARVQACQVFRVQEPAASLAAANKRIGNLLRKAREAGESIPGAVDDKRLEHAAERALYQVLQQAGTDTRTLVASRNYQATLARLSELREPVDRFFDEVLVMSDDPAIKANRLALLAALKHLFDDVAEVGRLVISDGRS